jgi:nucleosome binding factor SPN SPT16 subunit
MTTRSEFGGTSTRLSHEHRCRYALQLVDTVLVEQDKAVLLTDGVRSPRDTLFFLNSGKDAKPAKKPPVKPLANANGSPAKNKTVGGKVLRTKTRSAALEDVIQSTVAKIAEHQKDLHSALQADGLAKYSEEGGGLSGKEGKSWKRFQSYKGEGALPPQVEQMRVCPEICRPNLHRLLMMARSDLCR